MMSSLRLFTAICLLLAPSAVSSFQSPQATPQRQRSIQGSQNPAASFRISPLWAGLEEDDAVKPLESASSTDIDKEATYAIAKEYAEKGLPEDSARSNVGPSSFTILLGCYVIFVIVDTVFHITPKENYIDALSNAVKNATS